MTLFIDDLFMKIRSSSAYFFSGVDANPIIGKKRWQLQGRREIIQSSLKSTPRMNGTVCAKER
jgi:hypothetical protein